MIVNRSSPSATVIPVLSYEDVVKASDWLCDAFGFRVRLRIGTHRVQLVFGDGAVILTDRGAAGNVSDAPDVVSHSVHVRVEDVDQHYARAQEHGARIVRAPSVWGAAVHGRRSWRPPVDVFPVDRRCRS